MMILFLKAQARSARGRVADIFGADPPLMDAVVPVKGSVDKSGHVRKPHTRRVKVRAPEVAKVSQTETPRSAHGLSDAEYQEIKQSAKYLSDVAYSTGELVGHDKRMMLRLMRDLSKSGRDKLLMDRYHITRDVAHQINNELDSSQVHHLRAQDMEDALDEFPGLRAIIDAAKGSKIPERKAEPAAPPERSQAFDPAGHVKIAADSIAKLRRSDVERVLTDGIDQAEHQQAMADYVKTQRPDLADEVNELMSDPDIAIGGVQAKVETPPEHRYAAVNRPPGYATVPDGYTRIDDRPNKGEDHHDIARHGVVVYPRPLTDQEMRSYELRPLVDGPDRDALVDQIATKLSEYRDAILELADDDIDDARQAVHDELANVKPAPSVGHAEAFADRVIEKLRASVSTPSPAIPEPVQRALDALLSPLTRGAEGLAIARGTQARDGGRYAGEYADQHRETWDAQRARITEKIATIPAGPNRDAAQAYIDAHMPDLELSAEEREWSRAAPQPPKARPIYENGEKISILGPDPAHPGFEQFTYLTGSKAGSVGLRRSPEARARDDQMRANENKQQAEAAKQIANDPRNDQSGIPMADRRKFWQGRTDVPAGIRTMFDKLGLPLDERANMTSSNPLAIMDVVSRDDMIEHYKAHRGEFLRQFSGRDAISQRNFVDAAEKAFGSDEIRSLGDGFTVQVDNGDGTMSTHMWTGSGVKKNDINAHFVKVGGEMAIDRSIAYKRAAQERSNPQSAASTRPEPTPAKAEAAKPLTINAMQAKLAELGRGYHDKIPLNEIFGHVRATGYEPVQDDGSPWSGFLTGADGRAVIPLTRDGKPTKASLTLSWHKMPSGRYEITPYVSGATAKRPMAKAFTLFLRPVAVIP